MEIETEDILLQKCRTLIEKKLGWGDPSAWATNDYELLGQKIQEVTNVSLSIATLKRIWGKIRYDSRPTITTLNTLAQFLGFENWRAFTQHHRKMNGNGHAHVAVEHAGQPVMPPSLPSPRKNRRGLIVAIAIAILAAGTFVVLKMEKTAGPPPDPGQYQFSSKKTVDEGVPNTVIFDYDATAASDHDTIFIQQSWDKRLREKVPRDGTHHTSIYYYPGFFQAKLVVNEKIVKEHNLFIKTHGWISCIEQKPVPVYFPEQTAKHDGMLTLPVENISSANVPLQPQTPWVSFYNVRDFGNLDSNDFIFETEVRNDYKEGSAVCQFTQIHVLMEGATMVIPLSIKGCVGELNMMGSDGKQTDLSNLGVDFSTWVKIKLTFKDKTAKIFINDKEAFNLDANMKPVKVVGIAYRFQGTGSVNYARLSTSAGNIVYDENF
jgi:hypothetical protein